MPDSGLGAGCTVVKVLTSIFMKLRHVGKLHKKAFYLAEVGCHSPMARSHLVYLIAIPVGL